MSRGVAAGRSAIESVVGFRVFCCVVVGGNTLPKGGRRVEGQPPIHRRLLWYEGGGGAPPPKNVGRLIYKHVDCEKSSVFFMLTT